MQERKENLLSFKIWNISIRQRIFGDELRSHCDPLEIWRGPLGNHMANFENTGVREESRIGETIVKYSLYIPIRAP